MKESEFRKKDLTKKKPAILDDLENVASHAIQQAGSFSHHQEYITVQEQIQRIAKELQKGIIIKSTLEKLLREIERHKND